MTFIEEYLNCLTEARKMDKLASKGQLSQDAVRRIHDAGLIKSQETYEKGILKGAHNKAKKAGATFKNLNKLGAADAKGIGLSGLAGTALGAGIGYLKDRKLSKQQGKRTWKNTLKGAAIGGGTGVAVGLGGVTAERSMFKKLTKGGPGAIGPLRRGYYTTALNADHEADELVAARKQQKQKGSRLTLPSFYSHVDPSVINKEKKQINKLTTYFGDDNSHSLAGQAHAMKRLRTGTGEYDRVDNLTAADKKRMKKNQRATFTDVAKYKTADEFRNTHKPVGLEDKSAVQRYAMGVDENDVKKIIGQK